MAEEQLVTVTFGAGPMGMGLSAGSVIVNVAAGGQAEAAGVRVGDALVRVADKPLTGLSYDAVLALIRGAARPVALTFKTSPAVVQSGYIGTQNANVTSNAFTTAAGDTVSVITAPSSSTA
jgi:C-terminal processing protease CtpA/Prc